MTIKAQKPVAVAAVDDGMPDNVRNFLEMLAAGPPKRTIKIFAAPKGVRDFRALVMREASNEDTLNAALATDTVLSEQEKQSIRAVISRERLETAKLTIVALADVDGGWRLVDHSVPFTEPDEWSQKGAIALSVWFNDLNSLDDDDVKKSLEEAVVIGQRPPRDVGVAAGAKGR